MGTRKKIGIDMDGVLANNKLQYLNYYLKENQTNFAEEDMLADELLCLPDKTAVARYLRTSGFFRDIPVSKDAQSVVKALQEKYDVYIVSAAIEFPDSLIEKRDWLEEHFPAISWQNIVFCGSKSIINTDFLIDDHVRNLKKFKGNGLLFEAFHNINEKGFERLKDWNHVGEYFLGK